MQSGIDSLQNRLEPAVTGLGYELVCVELQGTGNDSVLRLYIDSAEGIGLEDCVKVSREISAMLDVDDPIDSAYRLEVSSPGLDRPLVKQEHFQDFAGQEAKVKLRFGVDGRRNFRGRILSCEDGRLQLQVDNEVVEMPVDDIDRARLVPDFKANRP